MEADATYLRSYFGNPAAAAYNLRRLPRTGGGRESTRFYAVDATTRPAIVHVDFDCHPV